MQIQSNVKEFYAGDNLNWEICSTDYSSVDNFVLKIILLHATKQKIEFIADGQTDGSWKVTKTATETASLQIGKYNLYFVIYKSSAGIAEQASVGVVEIKPNILTSANYDFRTENQKLLDVVRERIAGRLTEGMSAFTINGRSVTLLEFSELIKLEKELESKVAQELALEDLKKKGRTNRNKLVVRYKSGL